MRIERKFKPPIGGWAAPRENGRPHVIGYYGSWEDAERAARDLTIAASTMKVDPLYDCRKFDRRRNDRRENEIGRRLPQDRRRKEE